VKGGGLYLNTQSFTIIENVRLINVLILKFNCKCSIHMQRGLPVIYISARSMRKLYPLLEQYFTPGMLYKLRKISALQPWLLHLKKVDLRDRMNYY
jgi:hypothetical protein